MRIGYARVSTGEQNLQLQLDALEEEGCEEIHKEEISGAAEERPKLEHALSRLRGGDTLVVWRLDRLWRSLNDLVEKVDRIEDAGADFHSLQESIDTTSAGGKLTFHIFGALAEFERELTRERTMAGLRAARAEGNIGGRPPAVSEAEIPQLQALVKDHDVTTSEVCDRFDISAATLYRYVSPEGDRRKHLGK